MSPLNLKSPLVAGVVLTLLAVVAVVNLKTFLPGGGDSRLTARQRRAPRPPAELASIVESVLNDDNMLSVVVAARDAAIDGMSRDPFSSDAEPVAVSISSAASSTSDAPARRSGALDCTAVIVDGSGSVALINGHGYRVGDRVDGHEILAIDADGIRVVDARGRQRTLSVQPRGNDSNFEITFNSRQDNPAPHRDVADGNEQERRMR